MRVAAAAGAAGVITTGRQNPWHPDALRGSAGLHFALPVARSREVRTGDRPLIALDPDGEPLGDADVPARAVLAFGTERDGLSDDAARPRRRPPGAADAPGRVQPEPRDRRLGRAVLAQRTPMRSTTKISVSSGPMTPPAPRLP